MTRPPAPEDLLDPSAEAPLALTLECNRCGRSYKGEFEWACLHPEPKTVEEDWDGILLSRIMECAGCGAIDDYTLASRSYLKLTSRILFGLDRRSGKSRIIRAASQLWDGTIARRPSQGLARLRQLAAEHPNCAEAYRRLGNGCERWGQMEEAVTSWKKAVELDPAEVEAAYSLATYLWGRGGRPAEGFAYLRKGLKALGKAAIAKRDPGPWGAQLVSLLRSVLEHTAEPIALMACWRDGEVNGKANVNLSSIDLRKVDNFDRLVDFVSRPDLLGLDLTPELPEEEPTILQRLLAGGFDAVPRTGSEVVLSLPRQPIRAPKAVGRNEPCLCGSGKKYKRCCGG